MYIIIFYICLSLLKNTIFNFGLLENKLITSRILFSSNEKSYSAIFHNLVFSSL